MNAVANITPQQSIATELAVRTALKSSLYPGASDKSVDMVLAYCQAAKLDPMTKPVHIVPMWDSKAATMRDVVMPGIGLYRIQAARTKELAGISEPEFGPIVREKVGNLEIVFPEWCRVVVKRTLPNGAVAEFTAVEYWIENYAIKGGKEKDQSPNAMWAKRPRGQIAKCAQAQALRMAFPEIGSAPTAEEMEGKALDVAHSDAAPVQAHVVQEHRTLAPYPAIDFDRNLPVWRSLIENGKKSADDIIAMVATKGTLTDAQCAAIRGTSGQNKPDIVDGEFEPKGDAA